MAGAAIVGGGGGGVGGGAVSFPLVFFDGECETGIGNVVIHPMMDFMALQSLLSRKIGISPHQFSVYIATSNDPRSRLPVTGKVNFSALCHETKGCFFLVVLKRSRRVRTRKGKKEEPYPPAAAAALKKEPPANVMLLRRGGGEGDARVLTGLDEFQKRVWQLQMEKERYLANLGRIERESKGFACKECEIAKVVGRDAGFHRCLNDAVTFGFRSYAGPIARPGKGPGSFEGEK